MNSSDLVAANKITSSNRKQYLMHAFIAAAFFSFTFLFINPLNIYFSSPDRLGNITFDFTLSILVAAGGLSLILTLPRLILGKYYYALLLWLACCAFIYGSLVIFDYGLFRGNGFTDEDRIYQLARDWVVVEIGLLIVLFLLLCFLPDSFSRLFSVFFTIVLFGGLLDLGFSYQGYLSDKQMNIQAQVNDAEASSKKPASGELELNKTFEFSKQGKNIILIIPDAGAGFLLPELFEDEALRERFRGFTYYPNTVSVGAYTLPSAAAVIGGDKYSPDNINKMNSLTLHAHLSNAYQWLISSLDKANFSSVIINPKWVDCTILKQTAFCGESRNDKEKLFAKEQFVPIETVDVDVKTVAAFSLFKVLPISLKAKYYKSKNWNQALNSYSQLILTINDGISDYFFLNNLASMSNIDQSSTRNQFIHIWYNELVAPFNLDVNCEISKEEGRKEMYSMAARKKSTRCFLSSLGVWLTWMKENELYNNTKIIIVADHGAEDYGARWHKGAANPMLLVKEFQDNEDYRASDILMQNSDASAMICSGAGGCEGASKDPTLFPIEDRVAHYYITNHSSLKMKTSKQFKIKKKYEIKGNIWDDPYFELEKLGR